MIQTLDTNAQLAECKGKYLGNIVAGYVPSNYTQLWNGVTAENGSKWGHIERNRDQMNWTDSDRAYNLAMTNGYEFRYHAIAWGSQYPTWIENLSSAEFKEELEEYMIAIKNRYPNIHQIDVLNENLRTHAPGTPIFREKLGGAGTSGYDWIVWIFEKARLHFPNSKLIINDYGLENDQSAIREQLQVIEVLKARNLIDGFGTQAHEFNINNLTAAQLKSSLDLMATSGLPIYVTELDISGDDNTQKERYERLFPVYWNHPSVAGISIWGYVFGETWKDGTGLINNGQDRPAMTWLRQYMASLPDVCSNNNTPTVAITSPAQDASFLSPASVTISANATDTDGQVSKVEFFHGATLIGSDNTAPYSVTWNVSQTGTYSITAVATDNEGATKTSTAVSVRIAVPQGPYNNTRAQIPGIIQAEEYDLGGQDVAYNDSSPGSETTVTFRSNEDVDLENCTDTGGGYNIGYATAGEWVEYSVDITQTGTYTIALRIACNGEGRTMHIEMDGTDITGNISIPNTAGWQVWQTVNINGVEITEGDKVMRVVIGSADYVNINYFSYSLEAQNVAPTVTINSPTNNTSYDLNPSTITIEASANDADGSVSGVSFYNGATLLGTDNNAPYSFVWENVVAGTYTITAVVTDNEGETATSEEIVVEVLNVVPQSPYNGSPFPIPGLIEAEQYDLGGQGVSYNELGTNGNEGGATLRNDEVDIEETGDSSGDYNIGYILDGEWLEYTVNVNETDSYSINLRVATDGTGRTMHVEMDGQDVTGPISIPNTGGYQTFQTVTLPNILLDAGEQVMRLVFDANYFNINYVSFEASTITGSLSKNDSDHFDCFPNPYYETMKIYKKGAFGYTVYDALGNQIDKGSGINQILIGENFSPGIYFLSLSSEAGNETIKIIKK